MSPTLKAGIVLGVVVEAWTFLILLLGWQKDPALLPLFYLVILFEAVVLFWGLRMTAAAGKTYGEQVLAGTLMSAYGAAIIFVGAYLLTSTVFPEYFSELESAGREAMTRQGLSEAEIAQRLDAARPMQNSFVNAATGAIATIITGVVFSAIIGAFVKAKAPAVPATGS